MISLHRSRSCRSVGPALVFVGAVATGVGFAAEGVITPADRAHWAFRPIARAQPPAGGTVATPIDAFVLARLRDAGLELSPEADKRTLIRRLTLDLTGLPPTAAEVQAFVGDASPDAYDRLVDRLLADPRYGERRGRQWLDLVRFAETAGYKSDEHRPLAYRYRDYVVRAFNENLPYDRFVREQLAGDELDPGNEQALVATGYLRLWPDESNASDVQKARQDALNDITGNVGSVFLGLTVACAQCHDHKFDPILQTDFYELQAYFSGLLPEDRLPVGSAAELGGFRDALTRWEAGIEPILEELHELELAARREVGRDKRLKFPADILEAIDVRAGERTTRQRQIAYWAERQIDKEVKGEEIEKRLSEAARARRKELQARLTEAERSRPRPPRTAEVMAVIDSPAGPAESHLLLAGSPDLADEEVRPKGLTVLEPVSAASDTVPVPRPGSSGRRAALAAWLTDPANPLPARVMANRLWQGHFGRGLVATANDFGVQAAPPTHPELLDWLADELIASGWDVKHLQRLIVTSDVYRQAGGSRVADPRAVAGDPRNELLWHFPRRRLESEAIRDSLLFVAGRLDDGMYGPGVRPELPAGFSTAEPWEPSETARDRSRRSVYVYAKRNLPHPFLAAFDLPDMHESCGCRVTTTTAPQALTLLNGEEVLDAAGRLTVEVLAAGDSLDPADLIERAFLRVLGRTPTVEESVVAAAFLRDQERIALTELEGPDKESALTRLPGGLPPEVTPQRRLAVADFCHALLNTNEFLYIE